ncbi:TetR/AcrR family transcriptional regulator [bacterium]|nr:TetR/AcrR family transcriptional regulator [bacterium]
MASNEYQDMRDQIIEAAREVFAKYGYRKTTIEDIASSVYKAKSSVYHYFSGKDDIFRAVIEKEASHMLQSLREAVDAEQSPVMKFRTCFRFLCEKIEETSNYYRFLKDEWFHIFDFTTEVRIKNEQHLADMFISIFNEGNRTGVFAIDNPKSKAKAIQIALFGFIMPFGSFTGTGRAVLDSIDPFLDIALHGIMSKQEISR